MTFYMSVYETFQVELLRFCLELYKPYDHFRLKNKIRNSVFNCIINSQIQLINCKQYYMCVWVHNKILTMDESRNEKKKNFFYYSVFSLFHSLQELMNDRRNIVKTSQVARKRLKPMTISASFSLD